MEYATGTIWVDIKEFLPNFKIRCDVYLKTEDKWALSDKDMIIQENPDDYHMLKDKWDRSDVRNIQKNISI